MTVTSETEHVANHSTKRRASSDRPVVVQFQAAPPSPPVGPRAKRRVEWIALSEEGEYAQHQILARIRYPDSLNTEFGSSDFALIKKALRQIVLEHNGWIDPDSDTDEPLPPAQGENSDVFWDSLAQEEILLMLRAVGGARKKVLASLLETKSD